jgi:hypothetical protein
LRGREVSVGQPAQTLHAVETLISAQQRLAIVTAKAGDPIVVFTKPLSGMADSREDVEHQGLRPSGRV